MLPQLGQQPQHLPVEEQPGLPVGIRIAQALRHHAVDLLDLDEVVAVHVALGQQLQRPLHQLPAQRLARSGDLGGVDHLIQRAVQAFQIQQGLGRMQVVLRKRRAHAFFSITACTASSIAARRPARSSASTPRMVVPAGEHTPSLIAPGCMPVSICILPVPESVWLASR